MATLSRSSRNRLARNTRGTAPRGVVGVHTPARPGIAVSPLDSRIRCVGYLGHNPTSVHYSGSGDAGYRSEWAGSADFFTDPRWSDPINTVTHYRAESEGVLS